MKYEDRIARYQKSLEDKPFKQQPSRAKPLVVTLAKTVPDEVPISKEYAFEDLDPTQRYALIIQRIYRYKTVDMPKGQFLPTGPERRIATVYYQNGEWFHDLLKTHRGFEHGLVAAADAASIYRKRHFNNRPTVQKVVPI